MEYPCVLIVATPTYYNHCSIKKYLFCTYRGDNLNTSIISKVVICVNITIRNVNRKIYQEFKAEAARRGLTMGQALTLAMKEFITPEKKEISILDFKPFDWGKGTEKTSEDVDKILYRS